MTTHYNDYHYAISRGDAVKEMLPYIVVIIGFIAVCIGIVALYRALRRATKNQPRLNQAITFIGRSLAILFVVYLILTGDNYNMASHHRWQMYDGSHLATLLKIGVFFGVGYLCLVACGRKKK